MLAELGMLGRDLAHGGGDGAADVQTGALGDRSRFAAARGPSASRTTARA
jgi:hypothetical protein